MIDIGLIIGGIIGQGYVLLTIANSSRQSKKYYYKLFNNKIFAVHFFCAALFMGFGTWKFRQFDGRELFYSLPFIFLLVLRLTDKVVEGLYGRHLILALRWDRPPKGEKGIKPIDNLMLMILLVAPLFVSAYLHIHFF
jgi:hypothetical protein